MADEAPQAEKEVNNHSDEWLDDVNPALREVALKYGQNIFNITVDIGLANAALGVLSRRSRGNNELMKALTIVSGVLDKLCRTVLADHGWQAQMLACTAEIERVLAGQLTLPPAAGKIILPH